MQRTFCPLCHTYLMHITNDIKLVGWRKCPTCSYCEDREGQNEISRMVDKSSLQESRSVCIQHYLKALSSREEND